MKTLRQDGFTIIELMIALSVMSVILVASTVVMIQIGALYSKGVNQANLQNATRNVSQDLSSTLQFNANNFQTGTFNASSGVTINSYCIDTARYSYLINHELGTDQFNNVTTNHVLWRDTMKDSSGGCPPMDITRAVPTDTGTSGLTSGDGYEMLGNHMSLQAFNISTSASATGPASVYSVSVWTAFGDSDLVNPADFTNNVYPSCRGTTGDQYCAVSEINTSVTPRLIKAD